MNHAPLLSAIVGILLFTGCQGSSSNLPQLAKVSGTVDLDGKPMDFGEVRFLTNGNPAKSLEVKNGSFAGEVFIGENHVDVVCEKDGPPHPMEPGKFQKVNVVDSKFSGLNSTLKQDVSKQGASNLKFVVTSAK